MLHPIDLFVASAEWGRISTNLGLKYSSLNCDRESRTTWAQAVAIKATSVTMKVNAALPISAVQSPVGSWASIPRLSKTTLRYVNSSFSGSSTWHLSQNKFHRLRKSLEWPSSPSLYDKTQCPRKWVQQFYPLHSIRLCDTRKGCFLIVSHS